MTNLTPFSDPDEVLSVIRPVSDRIQLGLHKLLPETRKYFESKALPVDKALHAMMTRFELKHFLLGQQIRADNEEDVDFSIKGLANCGLVVSTANCVLRVLKWHNFELPAAGSDERYAFYQHNLFAFEKNDPHPGDPLPPLNLVAAWNSGSTHELSTFSIVCPFGESENQVQLKWWRTLPLPSLPPAVVIVMPPEPQLEEITPKLPNGQEILQGKNTGLETDQAGSAHDAD